MCTQFDASVPNAAIPSSDEPGTSWNKGGGSAVLWLDRINHNISEKRCDERECDPVSTYELNHMFDVKQVRAQMKRTDTDTPRNDHGRFKGSMPLQIVGIN